MINIEKKAIALFTKFWRIYSSREEDTIERAMSIIHESFNGSGTAISEIWKYKNDLILQLEKEIKQIPQGYKINFLEITANLINNTVVIAANLTVEFNFNGKLVLSDTVRFSGVIIEEQGKLLISQLHCSVPDASIEEEVTPGSLEPRIYDSTSILFTDFVGFTKMTSSIDPKTLIENLNKLFTKFDEISQRNGIFKIKTIGDAYFDFNFVHQDGMNFLDFCDYASKKYVSAKGEVLVNICKQVQDSGQAKRSSELNK